MGVDEHTYDTYVLFRTEQSGCLSDGPIMANLLAVRRRAESGPKRAREGEHKHAHTHKDDKRREASSVSIVQPKRGSKKEVSVAVALISSFFRHAILGAAVRLRARQRLPGRFHLLLLFSNDKDIRLLEMQNGLLRSVPIVLTSAQEF